MGISSISETYYANFCSRERSIKQPYFRSGGQRWIEACASLFIVRSPYSIQEQGPLLSLYIQSFRTNASHGTTIVRVSRLNSQCYSFSDLMEQVNDDSSRMSYASRAMQRVMKNEGEEFIAAMCSNVIQKIQHYRQTLGV